MKRIIIGILVAAGWLFLAWVYLFLCAPLLRGQQLYVGPEHAIPRWIAEMDAGVLWCRGYYTADRAEANGSGWFTDYPGADINISTRLDELTRVDRVTPVVVKLDGELLFKCPFLFMEDVGILRFTPEEVSNLRRYFAQGGFLWVADFWGQAAWDQWMFEIQRVLPMMRLIDVPAEHVIHRMLFQTKVVQQPNVGLWEVCDDEGSGCYHQTTERGPAPVSFRALADVRGRLQVVMTHNTDIPDGWNDAMDMGDGDVSARYALEFAAGSYALAINIFLYALTH